MFVHYCSSHLQRVIVLQREIGVAKHSYLGVSIARSRAERALKRARESSAYLSQVAKQALYNDERGITASSGWQPDIFGAAKVAAPKKKKKKGRAKRKRAKKALAKRSRGKQRRGKKERAAESQRQAKTLSCLIARFGPLCTVVQKSGTELIPVSVLGRTVCVCSLCNLCFRCNFCFRYNILQEKTIHKGNKLFLFPALC